MAIFMYVWLMLMKHGYVCMLWLWRKIIWPDVMYGRGVMPVAMSASAMARGWLNGMAPSGE
jgi:hypothetical protein